MQILPFLSEDMSVFVVLYFIRNSNFPHSLPSLRCPEPVLPENPVYVEVTRTAKADVPESRQALPPEDCHGRQHFHHR